MAGRVKKHTVEYFPHFCSHGSAVFIIESIWGNDGYAAFYRLLELLGKTEDHYYRAGTEERMLFVAATMKIEYEKAQDILCKLAKMEVIDKDLWDVERGIWMQTFVDSLEPVYQKRSNPAPIKPSMDEPVNTGSEMLIPGSKKGITGPEKGNNGAGKPKKEKRTFPISGDEVMLADRLLQNIRALAPNFKGPDIMTWAADIDAMIRIDKRPVADIQRVIDYVKTDEFWRAVILSAGNLRKKYDQLYMKMEKGNGKGKTAAQHSEPGKHYPGPDVEA